MPASQYDFSIEQGSSFILSLVYKNSSNEPINMAGYSAKLTWKTNTGQLQVFTTENTNLNVYKFTVNEDNPGSIVLRIPHYTTELFKFKTAKYDLEIYSDTDFYNEGNQVSGGKYATRLLFGNIGIIKKYSNPDSITKNC